MLTLQIFKNSEINHIDLDRAIAVKQVAWPYSKDSQLEWIKNNLKADDIHIFLVDGKVDVAYMNVVWVSVIINGVNTCCAGVGNVCAKYIGKGYGKLMMTKVMEYLHERNYIGLLFCKDSLIDFYEKVGWKLISPELITLPDNLSGVNTMVCNITELKAITYNDRSF